jgi:hypothetical protein
MLNTFQLKELLSLALCQLEDHLDKDEDIQFAYSNIETALEEVVKEIKETNHERP